MNLSVELAEARKYANVDLTLEEERVSGTQEQEELIRILGQYIEQYCSREVNALVKDTVQQYRNERKTRIEIADYQLQKLTHYLINRVNHLQEEIGRITKDNEQLQLDNQRKIQEKRRVEELVAPVEAQNEELKNLLQERGVTKDIVDRLLGEQATQERKDLDQALKQVRELQTHIKRLEREHELAFETSFFHKNPNNELLENIKPNSREMNTSVSQRVRDNVPPFSGEEVDVETALKRYLRGCEISREGARPEEESAFVNSLLVRLHGKAFEVAESVPLDSVKQLTELLRDLYLKPKDLDTITDEVRETHQRRGEGVRQFDRRLEILRNDAKRVMLKAYGESCTGTLLREFDRKIITTFVLGLRDTVIKTCLLSCPEIGHRFEDRRNQNLEMKRSNDGRQTNNERNINDYTERCNWCDMLGHNMSNCFAKQKFAKETNCKERRAEQPNLTRVFVSSTRVIGPEIHTKGNDATRKLEKESVAMENLQDSNTKTTVAKATTKSEKESVAMEKLQDSSTRTTVAKVECAGERHRANGEKESVVGCYAMKCANAVYIEIPYEHAKDKKLVLLVDSGAEVSLVKKSTMTTNIKLNTNERKNMEGAFGGYERTQGSIKMSHEILSGVSFKFHVVGDNTELPADGVLGRDNMWGKAIVNSCTQELVFMDELKREIFKLPMVTLERGKALSKPACEARIIEGRAMRPIKMKVNTNVSVIVVHKKELAPGIYLGEAVTDVKDGEAIVPVLNTTEVDYAIEENFRPSFTDYNQFLSPNVINEGLIKGMKNVSESLRQTQEKVEKSINVLGTQTTRALSIAEVMLVALPVYAEIESVNKHLDKILDTITMSQQGIMPHDILTSDEKNLYGITAKMLPLVRFSSLMIGGKVVSVVNLPIET